MVTAIALIVLVTSLVAIVFHELGRRYPTFWCVVHRHDGFAVRRLTLNSYKVTCLRCGGLFLAKKELFGWSYTTWTSLDESWFTEHRERVIDEHETTTGHR